jgi:hypothetical protein
MHKLVKEYIDSTTATRTKEVKNINVKLPKHISEAILIKEVDDRFEKATWIVRGMTENGTCFSVRVWNEKQVQCFEPNEKHPNGYREFFKKRYRISQRNHNQEEHLNSTPSVKQACRRIADKLTSACAEFAPTEN